MRQMGQAVLRFILSSLSRARLHLSQQLIGGLAGRCIIEFSGERMMVTGSHVTDGAGSLMRLSVGLAHEALLNGNGVLVQGHLEPHQLRVALEQLEHEQLEVAGRQHLDRELMCACRDGLGQVVILFERLRSLQSDMDLVSVFYRCRAVDIFAVLKHPVPELLPVNIALVTLP